MKDRIISTLYPVLLAFITCAFLIILIGKNPFSIYGQMIVGSIGSWDSWINTLFIATPLIISGLAFAIAFKAGFFNMAVESQIYLGGFVAAWVGFSWNLPIIIHVIVAFIFAIFSGVLLGSFIGILRGRFNINEIVITLMLNNIIILFINHLTNNVFYSGEGFSATPRVFNTAILPRFTELSQLNFSFIITIIVVLIVSYILKKTTFGLRIKLLGTNRSFAEASGMNTIKYCILIFAFSGGLATIAGVGEILGTHQRFVAGFSPGYGWDGMTIALLAKAHPIGIFFASIFLAVIKNGSSSIELFSGIPRSLASILQGLIILFLAIDYTAPYTKEFIVKLKFWEKK